MTQIICTHCLLLSSCSPPHPTPPHTFTCPLLSGELIVSGKYILLKNSESKVKQGKTILERFDCGEKECLSCAISQQLPEEKQNKGNQSVGWRSREPRAVACRGRGGVVGGVFVNLASRDVTEAGDSWRL